MISVVIPTHNRCNMVVRAIESVQNQTYKDLEIVVVSDGSTDDTKTQVEEISAQDHRVRCIDYYPAKGGNVARNIGIKESIGEWVAFLDDDDEWYTEKLEKQMALVKKKERIGLVYTGVHVVYEREGVSYSSVPQTEGNLKKEILLDNCIGTTSTVMVRKALLDKVEGFDISLAALQDYDLWIRLCQICDVGVIPEELITYNNYTGKKQVSGNTKKYEEAFEKINKKYKDLFCTLTEKEKKEKLINEYMLLANKSMRNGDKKKTREYCCKALNVGHNKKAIIYYFLSFSSFKTVLRFRSMK